MKEHRTSDRALQTIPTPYYLIDERRLLKNLKVIKHIRESCGARSVLALKCFSTWSVFDLMKQYMDGTTSSSLFEARLGREKFGKEVHAYSVAFSRDDVRSVRRYADKIIFNSLSQLKNFYRDARGCSIGLRLNPGISFSHFDLADPARRYSRLGVSGRAALDEFQELIDGVMFHFNCENDDFTNYARALDRISRMYERILLKVDWVSLGGGVYFTKSGYPLQKFCRKLKDFSSAFGVQVYLEPGESSITQSTELVTTVLDVVRNETDIAIVDCSSEAHMLDLLVYRTEAKIKGTGRGPHRYIVAGRSCLAGDIFGTYRFPYKLKPGSIVRIADAAGYTMVKKNWFNGLSMPSIAVRRLDGSLEIVRRFTYSDFVNGLS